MLYGEVMMRSVSLALTLALALPVAFACTVSEVSGPARTPPATSQPVAANGPLPAGVYDVQERVIYDTCRPSRTLPPQVTMLKRHEGGLSRASVPIQRFGDFQKRPSRVDVDLRGYQASGMSHPKYCPGHQNTYRESFDRLSDTSFAVNVEFEVADGWDCPNPAPVPVCKTRVVYEYRLAQAACDARCDGTVPGMRDRDVPDGPVAVSCACP